MWSILFTFRYISFCLLYVLWLPQYYLYTNIILSTFSMHTVTKECNASISISSVSSTTFAKSNSLVHFYMQPVTASLNGARCSRCEVVSGIVFKAMLLFYMLRIDPEVNNFWFFLKVSIRFNSIITVQICNS
jgi:hypothetical protein